MNSIDYFDRGWRLDPCAPCLIHGETGETLSYDQVRQTTLRIANALRRDQFSIGSKAAVLSYNDPIGYSVVLSILRAGVTWLPINPRNGIADNAQILSLLDCDVLFFQSSFADAIPEIRRIAPNIRTFVCIDVEVEGAAYLTQWLANAGTEEVVTAHDPERVFVIQPTGGTTGFPKGVMLPNRALEAVVAGFMAAAPCVVRPVFLAVAPLTHAAGMVLQHLLAQGAAAVVCPAVHRMRILEAIPKHGVTHTFLPPTVIYDLLAEPSVCGRDYSSLRYFFYGASPMAPEKLRQAIKVFGPVFAQIYGQTESGVPNLFLSPSDHIVNGEIAPAQRLASAGRPTPFSHVAVMNDEGHLLPPGEIGELVVQGQGVMTGYYKDPDATAEVSRFGWHHTGDVGYQDEYGYFFIVDRMKDMIISGGFNIYSAEVERALLSHPAVQECAVIGVPDPKWGEAVLAIVQCKVDATVDAEELIAHCKSAIGSMKTPKKVEFVSELPRSAVGKVLKKDIRSRYWSGHERLVS